MNQERQEIIFSVEGLSRTFGQKEVLRGITLGFYHGAKIGIIGRNGCGKSTLLRILAGEDDGHEGRVSRRKGIRVGTVAQEPRLDDTKNVRANIEEGLRPVRALLDEYEQVGASLGENLDEEAMERACERMAALQERIDQIEGWELERQIEQAMHALGCPPGDAQVSTLSGGEKRRIALCRALLSYPDILLLDEPTNHLDADTVAWLERHLSDYPGTVLLVTHDRYFLDNLVGWMLEIERGRAIPYQGNYSEYLARRTEALAREERAEATREKAVARELEWIRQSPRARATKSKARITAFHALIESSLESREELPALSIPPGKRLGDRVVRADGIAKSYGGRPLMRDLSFELPPGGIVGVIGPNGAGKTTLLRIIAGEVEPDAGHLDVGPTVEICFVDQGRKELEDEQSVYQEVSEGHDTFRVGRREVNARAYLSRFGFRGEGQEKRVKDLSGGERNRVQMAKMLRRGGNLILLDEPTNDLDIPTLRLLEEALQAFPGCAVVVSHDRYFLDRVATHILAFEGEGRARLFEGSYEAYSRRVAAERRERGEPEEPARGAHRRFR